MDAMDFLDQRVYHRDSFQERARLRLAGYKESSDFKELYLSLHANATNAMTAADVVFYSGGHVAQDSHGLTIHQPTEYLPAFKEGWGLEACPIEGLELFIPRYLMDHVLGSDTPPPVNRVDEQPAAPQKIEYKWEQIHEEYPVVSSFIHSLMQESRFAPGIEPIAREHLASCLEKVGIFEDDRIKYRAKDSDSAFSSAMRRALRSNSQFHTYSQEVRTAILNRTVDRLRDINGFRLLVDSPNQAFELFEALYGTMDTSSVEGREHAFDFITFPRTTGFQGLNYSFIWNRYPVEIQIQTKAMEERAENDGFRKPAD